MAKEILFEVRPGACMFVCASSSSLGDCSPTPANPAAEASIFHIDELLKWIAEWDVDSMSLDERSKRGAQP
jgi:hypothetical protein